MPGANAFVMTEAEWQILDELYFVTSYAELREQAGLPAEQLHAGLCALLQKGWVCQMYFEKEHQDYRRLEQPELNMLDNFAYLATKAGLLAHNNR